VLGLIIGQGLTAVLSGIVLGILAALALGRIMGRLLYGVTPTDPLTLLAVCGVLGIVAFLACTLPARRALRVDPVVALRG
jgi:putative ABC transport system permease protein